MIYKHTPTGAILRLPDMVEIPQDSANADYQAYAEWAATNETLPAVPESPRECITALLADKEKAELVPRGVREFMLASIEAQAQAQGVNLATLYAANAGYKKAKDLDNQAKALRAVLKVLP